jgi:hypothetical protein
MEFIALTEKEFTEAMADLQPIADLKIGDKLIWKECMKAQKYPNYNEVIIVASLSFPEQYDEVGLQVVRRDFTALYKKEDDGKIFEYAHDSRLFKRVE